MHANETPPHALAPMAYAQRRVKLDADARRCGPTSERVLCYAWTGIEEEIGALAWAVVAGARRFSHLAVDIKCAEWSAAGHYFKERLQTGLMAVSVDQPDNRLAIRLLRENIEALSRRWTCCADNWKAHDTSTTPEFPDGARDALDLVLALARSVVALVADVPDGRHDLYREAFDALDEVQRSQPVVSS